ncbi:MAG: hypothetical protein Q8Q58_04960 [Candidatus Rokubacteria bacterium]|nr:hypothetical protein [Candidatus Rokubacteria bacterium]
MVTNGKVMLVVPRFDYALHAWLEKKFDADPEILVVRDRRSAHRRQRHEMRQSDRRQNDRRGLASHHTGVVVPIKTAAALGSS